MTDPRWFRRLGPCPNIIGKRVTPCGKPSVGVLMGGRNEEIGPSCQRCADKQIEKAKSERMVRETVSRAWQAVLASPLPLTPDEATPPPSALPAPTPAKAPRG